MGLLRCTAKKHGQFGHKWSGWTWDYSNGHLVYHRSCKCGAVQRHDKTSGEVTIWTPDGLNSGLLDQGLTRKIYEQLD